MPEVVSGIWNLDNLTSIDTSGITPERYLTTSALNAGASRTSDITRMLCGTGHLCGLP
jgi:hypothetical protein